jgi:hypothetical protein
MLGCLGESYSGVFIPVFAQHILQQNKRVLGNTTDEVLVNLKGVRSILMCLHTFIMRVWRVDCPWQRVELALLSVCNARICSWYGYHL